MRTYQIYIHTAPDGRSYIGQTCNRPKRDYAHKTNKRITPFTTAIELYGWDSFNHETIISGLTKVEADEMEMVLIAERKTLYPNGLNLHQGGEIKAIEVNKEYLADRPLHTRRTKSKSPSIDQQIASVKDCGRKARLEAKREQLRGDIERAKAETKKFNRRTYKRYY
ncbi:MAG: hypothetical protein ACXWTU_00425 [Methylotenera sp.]